MAGTVCRRVRRVQPSRATSVSDWLGDIAVWCGRVLPSFVFAFRYGLPMGTAFEGDKCQWLAWRDCRVMRPSLAEFRFRFSLLPVFFPVLAVRQLHFGVPWWPGVSCIYTSGLASPSLMWTATVWRIEQRPCIAPANSSKNKFNYGPSVQDDPLFPDLPRLYMSSEVGFMRPRQTRHEWE
jgi:hypothetical protein